ncbi:MAG: hypothetical protein US69_C0012G0025 [candidate division TM6 bacterium GW2011_GWF2_38_10]|nr:MAG: hypothetical protein US69_C0012G0025 [candidate division TM6 bacterium GW2011_GWF2_38_10]
MFERKAPMKNLGVSISSFENLIDGNFVYVDKTAFLYELVKNKGLYFFSRPRRFGKSLTCTTLDAIFRGKKELFKGLAISTMDYDWKEYPVIHISFADVSHKTVEDLNAVLEQDFSLIAKHYNIILQKDFAIDAQFKYIIQALYEKHGPVVVIIDEYDKPMLDHIGDSAMIEKMQAIMRSFYGVLKGNYVHSCLRFLFITGVSRFSKVSLFSELNNLEDISLNEKFSTMCGYTQHELEYNFNEHINTLAQKQSLTYEETLAELKRWYNGFQFYKTIERVYNPFSITNCLKTQDFQNYWFSSGTPKFMLNALTDAPEEKREELKEQLLTLELQQIAESELQNLNIARMYDHLLVLFLQTGYLTIKSYDKMDRMYSLSYPNEEVRSSCTEQIIKEITSINVSVFNQWINKLRRALVTDDLDLFCTQMQNFMRVLPHNIMVNREKFYQGVFFLVCKLLGIKMIVEDVTDIGFIDGVITTSAHVYVIEFKRDKTPEVALAQIKKNNYSFKYVVESDLPVVHVGINFDLEDGKQITLGWKREEL